MSRFAISTLSIDSLYILDRHFVGDQRGFLDRLFCQEELDFCLRGKSVCQINRTFTERQGTVRGLHFQYPPYAETKIITCLKGQVWDVAVDIRRGSPTFLQHHSVLLTEENQRSFVITEGFAHGFQSLEPNSELLYIHTANYRPEAEGALNACDEYLSIQWPQPIANRSQRDSEHPMLTDNFRGVDLR